MQIRQHEIDVCQSIVEQLQELSAFVKHWQQWVFFVFVKHLLYSRTMNIIFVVEYECNF